MPKFLLLCFKQLYSESMILSSDSECTLSLVIPTIRSLIAFFNNEKEKLLDLNIEYEYNEVTIIDNDHNQCFRSFSDFEDVVKESDFEKYICNLSSQSINIYNAKLELIENILKGISLKMIETNNLMLKLLYIKDCDGDSTAW